ncbi:hypothetical protein [Micromonospora sp. NBC_01638]|nr:hypothetical protein OG811_27710 [Micromonospora sp. NBC_01638]
MTVIVCVLLVDPDGRLLLQLRDGDARYHPRSACAIFPPYFVGSSGVTG